MSNFPNSNAFLKNNSSEGFILLGSTIALFIILSVFSIFLIRVVVKENQISNYNIIDIKTRNLAQSGLDHGAQLFKNFSSPYLAPVTKNFNNGQYTITYDPSYSETGSPLPYSHFAMIKSSASINDATRNTRIFVSSYPDAFNLAFFGNRTGSPILALSFDGSNDYISTPIGNYFGQNNALSVEAWINVTSNSNGPIFTVTNSPPGGGWNMPFLSIKGTIVYGWVWGVNGNAPLNHSISVGWHKLSLTYDPSANPTLNFYIDGINVASGNGQYSPSNSFNYWTTYNPGAKPSGVNSYLNGTIDEVSLWSRALTANEIASNYNGEITGNEAGLAGYWDFNENSGNAILDRSNNGNDGTINGATRSTLPDPFIESFSQSGGLINGDIFYNGTISNANLTGTAYTSTGSGGPLHPDPLPEFPIANTAYFSAMLDTISPAVGSGGGEDDDEDEVSGQIVTVTGTKDRKVSGSLYPSDQVNYSPGGSPNWWQVKVEFQPIGSNTTFNETYGENSRSSTRSWNWSIKDHVGNAAQVIVKKIWVRGDLSAGSEYLDNVTIGGHNFGRMYGVGDDGTWDIEYAHDGSTGESTCDDCIALVHGENTNNSTRAWTYSLDEFNSANNVIIKSIWVRGDFSASSEYLSNVTIGGHNFGTMQGAGDDAIWDRMFNGNKSVTMSGTNVSASVFPSVQINYAPGGTPNWWQLKVEFYQEPEPEGGGPLELTNSFNLSNIYPNGLFYGNDISLTGLTVTGSGRIYATGNINIVNCTISGNIEIASNGEVNISNSTLGSNVNSISNSIVLFSKGGLNIISGNVRGLIFNLGNNLSIAGSSNIEGSLYTLSTTTNFSGSTVTGSIVSKYGANLNNSIISKGPMPPIYGLSYGFSPMIIPGSYLEF